MQRKWSRTKHQSWNIPGLEITRGRWKGEYKVASLDDFKSVDLKTGAGLEKVRVFITEDVKWHPSNPIKYPLQEKYDWLRETLQGVRVDDPKLRTYNSPPTREATQPNPSDDPNRPGSSDNPKRITTMPDVPEGAEVLPEVDPGIDDSYVAQEKCHCATFIR